MACKRRLGVQNGELIYHLEQPVDHHFILSILSILDADDTRRGSRTQRTDVGALNLERILPPQQKTPIFAATGLRPSNPGKRQTGIFSNCLTFLISALVFLKVQLNVFTSLFRVLLPPATTVALSYDVILIEHAFLNYAAQQMELFTWLIQLLLRLLAIPRMSTSLLIIERHFFELHGLGRPPRDISRALAAGLSQMGRMCSSPDPA